MMQNTPNFAAWSNENLAKFALEAYLRLQAQQDTLEQLRGDLKDAMQLVRQLQQTGVLLGQATPALRL